MRPGFLVLAFAIFVCLNSVTADGSRSGSASGQKAPTFQARTIDGKTVNFPDDFKGKVVLLDFWATWCPPCRAEVPNVVSTYEQYHSKGFEILGVSLDRAKEGPKLIKFTQDNHMTWPQIYDGLAGKTPVAAKYGVHGIPCPFLVDGDTGMILADAREALGHKLPIVVEKALSAKSKK
jgi:peroxiredoxin